MKMVSRIGVTLLLGLAGAAVSAAPVLWVADATAKLNTVDAATGAVTIIGSTGSTYLTDIAFSPSGALYGVSGEGNLYQVNKVTAAVTLLGNTGLLPTSLVS